METNSLALLVWLGILFCISQSAIFSGLNLAMMGISRLRLEVEADAGNPQALRILALRKDSNFLLSTVLWGNVGINVLLTLLSNSVMTGLVAFLFSTVLITFAGEIAPQAYFSRNAMRMGSALAPLLRFYQLLLYPVARPSAWMLDRWLGKEGISLFREQDLHSLIRKHVESQHSEVGSLEGTGAINFLKLDDITVNQVGEVVDPQSILMLPIANEMPVFPDYERNVNDAFLRQIGHSGKKWVIIVDDDNQPHVALNSNDFLRDALYAEIAPSPIHYCHRPIIVKDDSTQLGKLLAEFKIAARHDADDVIENDLILVWGAQPRVIAGTDILGRLLRDIAVREIG